MDSRLSSAASWAASAALLLVTACGGPSPQLSTAEDRAEAEAIASGAEALVQGEPEAGGRRPQAAEETSPVASTTPSARERPSPIVLWCSDDKGPACVRVAQELGVPISPAEQIERVMLTNIQDQGNNCADPQIAALVERFTSALSLDRGRWHSHGGTTLDRGSIPGVYNAAGCLNCCDAQQPSIKVHAVETSVEPMYLVRVWEAGEN